MDRLSPHPSCATSYHLSFEQNPKVATLSFERNELDRQFSNFHRFTEIGTLFDCSYPRPVTAYTLEANKHTNLQLQAERCWSNADTQKCISSKLSSSSWRL